MTLHFSFLAEVMLTLPNLAFETKVILAFPFKT
jgi:hypothetical protein